jgi:hypothetical protein
MQHPFVFQPAIKNEESDIKNCYLVCCFVWVWNLEAHIYRRHRLRVFENTMLSNIFGTQLMLCPPHKISYQCILLTSNQQDATLYNILYYCRCSTCFGRFLRPSSGAQELYTQHQVRARLAAATASGVPGSQLHSDIYQMTYWYNWFSWWWALGCSKHVEKWNK